MQFKNNQEERFYKAVTCLLLGIDFLPDLKNVRFRPKIVFRERQISDRRVNFMGNRAVNFIRDRVVNFSGNRVPSPFYNLRMPPPIRKLNPIIRYQNVNTSQPRNIPRKPDMDFLGYKRRSFFPDTAN